MLLKKKKKTGDSPGKLFAFYALSWEINTCLYRVILTWLLTTFAHANTS